MGLSATLSTGLDCRALGNGLVTQLQAPSGQLGVITVPLNPQQLQAITGSAGAVNAAPVAAAVAELAGRIPGALAALPGVGAVLQPLTAIVALADQIAANDVPALFEQVLARLRDELSRPGVGGHAATLLRVAELLRAAPEGQVVQQLLAALLPQLDVSGAGADFPFLDILRGVEGATQILGGLMCLETVLAEAQQLSALMSTRLDPSVLAQQQAALLRALGSGPAGLAQRLAAVDAANPANTANSPAVAALVLELVAAAKSLAELRERFAFGLAMDEATLAYLDVARLQSEIDAGRAMIHLADAAPARRVAAALAGLLAPVLAFTPPGSPAGGLAALLAAAQTQVAGLAASLDTLNLDFVSLPLSDGLRTLTQPLRELQRLIDAVLAGLRAALDQVRAAVAALPLDELVGVIQTFVAPIAQALDAVRQLVLQIEAALQAAADAAGAALGQVDAALDAFKQQIDAFFGDARSAVEQLDLDAAMAAVAEQVQRFADVLAQAQMKPIFDAAVSAIDAAAGVVGAVPFNLLPESMKSDVDALVQPIKAVDTDATAGEIKNTLGITPDHGFALRDDLDAAIETVHLKFQALLTVVEENGPRQLLGEVDQALEDLATQVRALEPDLTLTPVRDALDSVRGALAQLDLNTLLQPLNAAFSQITQALDSLSVAQAIAPVQQAIGQARESVIQAIRLEQWDSSLDELRTQALTLLERVNPLGLQAPLEGALHEINTTLQRFPALNAGAGLGVVVAGMLGATGRRIQPASFAAVLGWLASAEVNAASAALAQRSAAFSAALGRAQSLVERVDPGAAGAALNGPFAALRAAAQGLAGRLPVGSSERATLVALLPTLASADIFGELAANRARYLQALTQAASLAEGLMRSGFSEADTGAAALRSVFEPLAPLREKLRALFRALGLAEGELSVGAVLQTLLAAAPPERLVGLVMPIFAALHRRLAHLLDAVIDPLKAATADLRALLDAVNLTPLVQAADGIVEQARSEILALSPERLLAEPLQAFAELKTALIDHDPLDEIAAILNNLQELVARVLEKLNLELLLEVPLEIYDHILSQVRQLDPRGLLSPVFDQLDVIAAQVDSGLDDTVASFKRLQDALPAGGGGSAGGGSVSVTL